MVTFFLKTSLSLKIALSLGLFLSAYSHAGEFSKIDLAVREAVIEHYTGDRAQNSTGLMSDEDIWGLDLSKNDPEKCLVTVSGYALVKRSFGNAVYHFWACVKRSAGRGYEVKVIDDTLVFD